MPGQQVGKHVALRLARARRRDGDDGTFARVGQRRAVGERADVQHVVAGRREHRVADIGRTQPRAPAGDQLLSGLLDEVLEPGRQVRLALELVDVAQHLGDDVVDGEVAALDRHVDRLSRRLRIRVILAQMPLRLAARALALAPHQREAPGTVIGIPAVGRAVQQFGDAQEFALLVVHRREAAAHRRPVVSVLPAAVVARVLPGAVVAHVQRPGALREHRLDHRHARRVVRTETLQPLRRGIVSRPHEVLFLRERHLLRIGRLEPEDGAHDEDDIARPGTEDEDGKHAECDRYRMLLQPAGKKAAETVGLGRRRAAQFLAVGGIAQHCEYEQEESHAEQADEQMHVPCLRVRFGLVCFSPSGRAGLLLPPAGIERAA